MRALVVPVGEAVGRVLFSTVFRNTGRKLMAKGHTLSEEDVRLLTTEGLAEVWVVSLEEHEIPEDTAVLRVAERAACGSVSVRLAAGGRANILATEPGVLLLDIDRMRDVNSTAEMVFTSLPPYSYVTEGERVASIKCAPFGVPLDELVRIEEMLGSGPAVIQVTPLRAPRVGVLFCDPVQPVRAVEQFGSVVRHRLESLGVRQWTSSRALEEDEPLVRSFLHLLKQDPTVILVASTTAPAGPEDAVGRAIRSLGGRIERFLAPVEPGNLALLAYKDSVGIVSAPGCLRTVRPNVLNLMLPPLLAGHRMSSREIAALGPGGLLGN